MNSSPARSKASTSARLFNVESRECSGRCSNAETVGLGVAQHESFHPKLESQPSSDENPESQQALVVVLDPDREDQGEAEPSLGWPDDGRGALVNHGTAEDLELDLAEGGSGVF